MKPHVRPMIKTWFMHTPAYRLFMARELTAVFVAGYLVFLLFWLQSLGEGYESFDALLMRMRSPVSLAFHLLVFVPALYHSITWFNLTPKAMPVRLGEKRVPDVLVAIGGGYLPWIVVSGVLAWILLG